MTPKHWARVRQTGAHGLRRGAWYAVVNDSKPSIVFLDVNKKNIAVDRTLLEIREGRPEAWSVVIRRPEDVARRDRELDLNPTYGVCPQCRSRSNLVAGAARARCAYCGGEFAIDWQRTC